jgi:D-alanyl-D-alanine carboxypeptidase
VTSIITWIVAILQALVVMATPAVAPLPVCAYADVEATHASYDDWRLTLVDTTYALPKDYAPPDLVYVGGQPVRAFVQPDLASLMSDAKHAGTPLRVVSGYRSYQNQRLTFDLWSAQAKADGTDVLLSSAQPGHSEHQLGTAIDFGTSDGTYPWQWRDWGATPQGTWLLANAWRYGFIESYPKGKSPGITCLRYEPWHYRYVGVDEAVAIHDSGLTSREWLWQHQS